jgi:hypothetical protein
VQIGTFGKEVYDKANMEAIEAVPEPSHDLPASATIPVPPLATGYFVYDSV